MTRMFPGAELGAFQTQGLALMKARQLEGMWQTTSWGLGWGVGPDCERPTGHALESMFPKVGHLDHWWNSR